MRLFAWAIVIAISITAFITFWPIPAGDKMSARSTACLSNIKQLALCQIMYSVDHDDRLPLAKNWAGQSMAYGKTMSMFECVSPQLKDGLGHGLYRPAAGLKTSSVVSEARMLMLYDTKDLSWNACGGLDQIPIPPRHPRGNTFGFVDGHAKVLSREALFDFMRPADLGP